MKELNKCENTIKEIETTKRHQISAEETIKCSLQWAIVVLLMTVIVCMTIAYVNCGCP